MRGAVREIFAPHSHDHADSVDDALAFSAQGIRAVKTVGEPGVTAIFQLVIVVLSNPGGAGRRHRSQLLRRDDRHPAVDRLRARRRAATKRYTYGLGRVEDLAGLLCC